ncbi:polymorphic toxin-type HINT domain-containing protein [Microbacterium sp. C7(2022)]|nr:polymorphic toxin-type HINT domain-containing protein [Microbacterium sp. C7(2022)]
MYDADGSRLARVDSTGATVYLPGGQEVHADPDGVTATRWYTFAGKTVAVRTGIGFAGVSSVVTDAHGTPVAYIDNLEWTAPIERIRTDPFGVARSEHTAALQGHGFLGAPADPTGLALLGTRYYDPGTGTFVSPDPLLDAGTPAQFNAYVYSGNNPMTWADPSGMSWFGDAWNNVTGFVKKHQAEIGGFVAGALVTAGCMAITAGAGSVGCFIAGGAVAGAVTNVWKQSQSGKKFDVRSFVTDTLIGGALGPAVGAAGKVIAPAASRLAGVVGNAFKPAASVVQKAASSTKSWTSSLTRPISQGAAKPAQASSCLTNSFVPGTLVLLANGSKAPIEDIQVGDLVTATDPESGETTAEPVIATITGTGEKDLVTITVAGPDGHGTVIATAGHPFWIPDRAEWVDAGDLLPGNWLRASSGIWVQVSAIEHDHREQTVHNLTVATTHTFYAYAGDEAVLTHNCGAGAVNSGPRGWSVGGDIYSATRGGNSPAWSTVRARFWKNEAASPQYGNWSEGQLSRMSTGGAPQRYNPDKGGIESMELSHEPIPFRDGGNAVVPRWPQDHAAVDPYRRPGY